MRQALPKRSSLPHFCCIPELLRNGSSRDDVQKRTEERGSADAPALGLLSDLNEPSIHALLRHQFIVGPLLDDVAAIHHKDLIGVLNGGEPVGDRDDRLAVGSEWQMKH